jgi:hypothetical protein
MLRRIVGLEKNVTYGKTHTVKLSYDVIEKKTTYIISVGKPLKRL